MNGCPCCLHISTMAVESQTDVKAKNRELRAKASAGGGDGKFSAASAYLHGCYCSLNNCRGHQGGYGCFECVRKAEDGEVPVDRGPGGVCGFDRVLVCDCDCWSVFMEHNRQKISTGVERTEEAVGGGEEEWEDWWW